MLLALAILLTCLATIITVLVIYANGMSDAPAQGFQGVYFIVIPWVAVAVTWAWWWWFL